MNWQNVKWILLREVRDQLRDRRTAFMIFILPLLLYPLLGVSFMQFSHFLLKKPSRVLVIGARQLPEDPPLFEGARFHPSLFSDSREADLLEVSFAREEPAEGGTPPPADPEERRQWARRELERGGFDAGVVFPADFSVRLARVRQMAAQRSAADEPAAKPEPVPSPEIVLNSSKAKAEITAAWLRNVLRGWSDRIGDATLQASGVPVAAARPFTPSVEQTDQDKHRRSARMWAQLFPIMMVLWAMTGAFYPAVDLCAGEKERGTLETLLSSPAKRIEIVVGKLLTIMLFSMATSLLNLLSVAATGLAVVRVMPDVGPPPWQAWIWLPVALIPVAALFSALCLALAAFARSTKEGQYYLMPLLLITMPLVLATLSPSLELTVGNAIIPVTGLCLLLRTLLEGQTTTALTMLAPVAAVTLACCYLAIRWAVEQFNSETVLFREGERLDLILWAKQFWRERGPTPTVAAAAWCGVLILLTKFFLSLNAQLPADFAQFARSTVATQLLMIALPTALVAAVSIRGVRQTFLLFWPGVGPVAAAAAMALAFHPVVVSLQSLVMWLYPMGPDIEALRRLETVIVQAPLWQLVLVMALLPAVCEEATFRGFILSGFRRSGHPLQAVVFSALLFGFAHGFLQQMIITAAVGLIVGFLAIRSGSLLPGVVFHLIHNTLAVSLTRVDVELRSQWPVLDWLLSPPGDGGVQYRLPVVIGGAVVVTVLIAWLAVRSTDPWAALSLRDALPDRERNSP